MAYTSRLVEARNGARMPKRKLTYREHVISRFRMEWNGITPFSRRLLQEGKTHAERSAILSKKRL